MKCSIANVAMVVLTRGGMLGQVNRCQCLRDNEQQQHQQRKDATAWSLANSVCANIAHHDNTLYSAITTNAVMRTMQSHTPLGVHEWGTGLFHIGNYSNWSD